MKVEGFKSGIAVAIAFGCLSIPRTLAQNAAGKTGPGTLMESGIQPEAMQLYRRATRELHQGDSVVAEKDANHALVIDPKFADASALAATAALAQQQFDRAAAEAAHALEIDPADEKAYVILATARNYLGHYSAAADALRHVRPQEQQTWQVAYQWARAEAGLQDLRQCLEWTNRAALSAPPDFGPLHLLRTSVLLALGENARAADELEIYLQFPSVNASQRDLLTQELHRLRQLPPNLAGSTPAAGD